MWSDEERRAYHRAYYQKRRRKIVDYLGGECAICGSKEDLQIDHKDPSQKAFDISRRLTLESVIYELEKCQLLCQAHHEEKTGQENSGFTHGTLYGWMRKKCSCEDCTVAKWEWHDRRNERRRTGVRGPYKTRRQTS